MQRNVVNTLRPIVTVASQPTALDEWPALSELPGKHAYAFQARDLLEIWVETIGAARGTKAQFVRVDTSEYQPLMLIPLGIESRFGLRVLTFLDGGMADYNAPILFEGAGLVDAAAMSLVWEAVLSALPAVDIAILEKMPANVFEVPNPFRWLATTNERESGHILSLVGNWDDFAKRRMPRRQDSRRKRRRLRDVGPVQFCVAEQVEETDRIFEAMFKQKQRRYLETRGIDESDKPGHRAYLRTMMERLSKSGQVQLSAITVSDEIVAAHWGLIAADRFYFLVPTFSAGKWTRFSPGRLLIEDLVEWSYRKKLRAFDFGTGDEPYKAEFCDRLVPMLLAELPLSPLGRGYANLRYLRRSLAESAVGPIVRACRTRLRQGKQWIRRVKS